MKKSTTKTKPQKVTKPIKSKPEKVSEKPKAGEIQITNNPAFIQETPAGFYGTAKHSCNLGDLISALPCLKKYWMVTSRQVKLYQTINLVAQYYPSATHPTTDDSGNMVCVNQKMFDMVSPLILSQTYIKSFERYNGETVTLDFDVIRGRADVGMPNLMIQSWLMFSFPDLSYDLSKAWIELTDIPTHPIRNQIDGKVIINFTERYRIGQTQMEYHFLRAYAPDLIFAGTETEHFKFCNFWQLNIPRLEVNDFLEYAYALKYSRFLMSNQSFGWNLATALGTPRLLEVCKWAANCQPFIGEDSFGYQFTPAAEYYFREMYNKTLRK